VPALAATSLAPRALVDASSTSRAVPNREGGAGCRSGRERTRRRILPAFRSWRKNIQDKADNTTRFFVLGRKSSGSVGGGKDITSLLGFRSAMKRRRIPERCSNAQPLASRGINLSKNRVAPEQETPMGLLFLPRCQRSTTMTRR